MEMGTFIKIFKENILFSVPTFVFASFCVCVISELQVLASLCKAIVIISLSFSPVIQSVGSLDALL